MFTIRQTVNKSSLDAADMNNIEGSVGPASEKPAETSNGEMKLSKRALRNMNRRKMESEGLGEKKPGYNMTRGEMQAARDELLYTMRNIDKEVLNETEYYYENGLRKVRPYYFKFVASAKGRWLGRTVYETYKEEFSHGSGFECTKLIERGTLKVLGVDTTPDYVFRESDIMTNIMHRHELPVAATPVRIIAETDDILAVDKPSSIPIHPCGRYRFNSLVFILAKEHGYKNLKVLYRLDRLTSGIVLLGKTDEKTSQIMEAIRNRQVKKEYIAKVEGVFPSETVECNQPIDILSSKLGVHRVSPNGKDSLTVFNLIATDGKTSVIRCHPKTGRTHQIRIHLQYLGYPIVNDPLYNGDVWGPEKGKNGIYHKTDEQLIKDIAEAHDASLYYDNISIGKRTAAGETSEEPPSKKCKVDDADVDNGVSSTDISTPEDVEDSTQPSYFDPDCNHCKVKCIDPKPEKLCIYLHALCYETSEWKFSTEMPSWAHYDSPTEVLEDSTSS